MDILVLLGLGPQHISDLLTGYSQASQVIGWWFSKSTYNKIQIGEGAFGYFGPALWNKLHFFFTN